MNKDQMLSVVRSIAKIAGAILAYKGAKDLAVLVNTPSLTEEVTGLVLGLVGLFASHKTHKVDNGNGTVNPPQNTDEKTPA